jgi:hypothetical protein
MQTGKPIMMMKTETPDLMIQLMEGANQTDTVNITRVEVNKGKCTLGAQLEPMGTNKEEYKHKK